jgi:hypothetical protein
MGKRESNKGERRVITMKHGARNQIVGKVTSMKHGDILRRA